MSKYPERSNDELEFFIDRKSFCILIRHSEMLRSVKVIPEHFKHRKIRIDTINISASVERFKEKSSCSYTDFKNRTTSFFHFLFVEFVISRSHMCVNHIVEARYI